MASLGTYVGQGTMVLWLVAGLALANACSSDSTTDFEAVAGAGASSGNASGGKPSGGRPSGGNSSSGRDTQGGEPSDGGAPSTNDGGEPSLAGTGGAAAGGKGGTGNGAGGKAGHGGGAGMAGNPSCVTKPEICDGLDNDCDNEIDQGDACPAGCTGARFGGKLYYFCDTVASAEAALNQCTGFGMSMLTIESKAENDFAVSKQAGSSWLGGSDELEEDHWQWADGTLFWEHEAIDGKYSFWADGEPNNDGPDGVEENCLVLQSADKEGRWNDLDCTVNEHRAACEAPLP